MKITFPYQDLSLKSIRGEKWKPAPGFEDNYEVSSLGRIKSLYRERVLHHGGIMPVAERILRLQCRVKRNLSVGDNLYTLMTSLYLDGIAYSYSVGRLVYHAFVAPFDLDDRAIMISYRGGDGRNLDYKNLFSTNITELSNASYENGRYISKLRKPVSQFSTNGKLIAQYPSMYEAGRANGINERGISNAATGNNWLFKGFVWQVGYAKRLKKDKLIQQAVGNTAAGQQAAEGVVHTTTNMSLENMEGERWKDFPGYEKLYKISNYGRVKALRKVSEGRQQHRYPERIKKLTETKRNRGAVGTESDKATFIATLCKNRRKKTFHIARYVYHLFVKSFDTGNAALRVYYKDGDPHNLHYTNLILKSAVWSITKKQQP